MKRWLLLVVAVLVLLGSAVPALAKTPEGLQVTPLRNYPTQAPGASTSGHLTLTNNTPTDQQVTMTTELFSVAGEDYEYRFSTAEETKWVHFDDNQISLTPKQSKVVNYTVDVPVGASPGGHYLALIASLTPASDSTHITEIKRVASLVYLEVTGNITKRSSLLDFSLPWFTTKPNVLTEVHIGNQGSSHTRARILLQGAAWPQHQPKNFDQLEGLVLPATVRKIAGTLQLPNTPGLYHITAEYAPTQGGVSQLHKTIIYMPVWAMVGLAILILLILSLPVRLVLSHLIKAKKS